MIITKIDFLKCLDKIEHFWWKIWSFDIDEIPDPRVFMYVLYTEWLCPNTQVPLIILNIFKYNII